mmetsp:Transcript_10210/g.32332  ORF Transcript_10210/g.32332 Transcript_10210/m.32332 type:complete len:210 (-) Transcript_10210:1340-1969(-)
MGRRRACQTPSRARAPERPRLGLAQAATGACLLGSALTARLARSPLAMRPRKPSQSWKILHRRRRCSASSGRAWSWTSRCWRAMGVLMLAVVAAVEAQAGWTDLVVGGVAGLVGRPARTTASAACLLGLVGLAAARMGCRPSLPWWAAWLRLAVILGCKACRGCRRECLECLECLACLKACLRGFLPGCAVRGLAVGSRRAAWVAAWVA